MLCSLPVPFNVYYQTSVCAIKSKRKTMEDRHVMIHNLNALYNIEETNPSSYYAVFDGHRGRDAAELCSTFLHQFLTENPVEFLNNPHVALTNAFCKVDNLFLNYSTKQRFRGGTTAVVTLLRPKEKKLHVAWVGDSEAFLYKQGHIIACVNPHTPARKDEAERIRKSNGSILYDRGIPRINGQLAVSRAIGDSVYKPIVIATPEYRSISLDDTADFLVIGSDGLFDCIDPATIAEKVYTYILNLPEKPEKIAKILVDNAAGNNSVDNITAIVVLLKNPYQIALASPLGIARNTNCDTSNVYIADNITAAREMAREFCTSRNIVSNNDPYQFFNTGAADSTADSHVILDNNDTSTTTDAVINPEKLKKEAKDLANNNSPNNDNNDDNVFDILLPTSTNDHEKHENNLTIEDNGDCKPNEDNDDDIDDCAKDLVKTERESVQHVSCVEENPVESDSEDEWNYIKGDQEKQKNLSVQSETLEESLDDSMSQLNPNAAEFVPVSPTRSAPSPVCRALIKDDEVLSFSPKRPMAVESVPNEFEFETEIKSRPSDVSVPSNHTEKEDETDHSTAGANPEQTFNGVCIDDIPEFHPGSTPVKSEEFHFGPNAAPFSPRMLDQSTAFSSTKANFGDDTQDILNSSFNDSNIIQPALKPQDPMTESFYAEKGGPNPFADDLNKVHDLPEDLDAFLEKTDTKDNLSQTISDLPEHYPLGQPFVDNDVAVIQTTDLDKISQDDEKELASPLEVEQTELKETNNVLSNSEEQQFKILDNSKLSGSTLAENFNNLKLDDVSLGKEICDLNEVTGTDQINLNSFKANVDGDFNVAEHIEDEISSESKEEIIDLQKTVERHLNLFDNLSDISNTTIEINANNEKSINMSDANEICLLNEEIIMDQSASSEIVLDKEADGVTCSSGNVDYSSINSSNIVGNASNIFESIPIDTESGSLKNEIEINLSYVEKTTQQQINDLLETASKQPLPDQEFLDKSDNKESFSFNMSNLPEHDPLGQPTVDNDAVTVPTTNLDTVQPDLFKLNVSEPNDSSIDNMTIDALSSFEFNNSQITEPQEVLNIESNVCLRSPEPSGDNLLCISPCDEATPDLEIHWSPIDLQEHKQEDITSSVKDDASSADELTSSVKSPEPPSLDSFVDHQAAAQSQILDSVAEDLEQNLQNHLVQLDELNKNNCEEPLLKEKEFDIKTEHINPEYAEPALITPSEESKTIDDLPAVTQAELPVQETEQPKDLPPASPTKEPTVPSTTKPPLNEVKLKPSKIDEKKPLSKPAGKLGVASKTAPATKIVANVPKARLAPKLGASKISSATTKSPTLRGPAKTATTAPKSAEAKSGTTTTSRLAERKPASAGATKPAVKLTLAKKPTSTETTAASKPISHRPATAPKSSAPPATTASRPATASRYTARTAAPAKPAATGTGSSTVTSTARSKLGTTTSRTATSKTTITATTKTSTNHTSTTVTAAKTTIPPKSRTIANGAPKPKVPPLSKTGAKSADIEKQNKESANKLTASRSVTSTTTSQTRATNGIKSTLPKKTEIKSSLNRPAATSKTLASGRTATTSKKTPINNSPKVTSKTKTTVTKIEKSKENGVGTVYVTEEVKDLTIVNNCETENFVKDNLQVDNKLVADTANGVVSAAEANI